MLEKARNGLKDITARSIGKVAEAKGRKMRRMQRTLTKLRKKANAVVAKEDLSEKEKAREVEKIYKKKVDGKERKRKQLVVGKKFEAGSAGKKGHGIKLVDKRLLSDSRAEKKASRKGNSKGKGGMPHSVKGGQGATQRRSATSISSIPRTAGQRPNVRRARRSLSAGMSVAGKRESGHGRRS